MLGFPHIFSAINKAVTIVFWIAGYNNISTKALGTTKMLVFVYKQFFECSLVWMMENVGNAPN